MRRLIAWWRTRHRHDYVYGRRGGTGWGVVTCSDPLCDYNDIY